MDRSRRFRDWQQRLFAAVNGHRLEIAIIGVVLSATVTLAWFIRLGSAPPRHVGDAVDLGEYGLPGVVLKLIYPTRLSPETHGLRADVVTVYARADSPEHVCPFELVLPLPDEAVAFVDSSGQHVPGRLAIEPGYPDGLPYELRIVHGRTQLQGRLLRPYLVNIMQAIRWDEQVMAVPELAFQIRLESQWLRSSRRVASFVAGVGLPCLLLVGGLLLAGIVWGRWRQRLQHARGKQLTAAHLKLREYVKLRQWPQARRELDGIRQLDSHYRDVEQIETLVSAAESASWRLEQLYSAGLAAYRRREWPEAIQSFRAIESETPYYRNVRFLERTATLYADLGSRDRSLRLAAAKALGEVADLVDPLPLLQALGDPSTEVADAAEASFRQMGLQAFNALLGGLASDVAATRMRSYRLLSSLGQDAREHLLAALRSSDPRITDSVARLLASLGAREELVQGLLWAPPSHQEGIAEALLSEGGASCMPLVQGLVRAPPEKRDLLVRVLVALRAREPVDRRLEELIRTTKDPRYKVLLRRVLAATPERFTADISQSPAAAHVSLPAEGTASATALPRKLRRLGHRGK